MILLYFTFVIQIGRLDCQSSRKVIIDCDPGVDDTYALQVLINDPTVDVIAITT